MRYLLFSGRVAFIFNLFFLACLVFRYNDVVADQSIKGFIIVVGWLIAPIINFIFNASLFIMKLLRHGDTSVPLWLVAFNFILLILQLLIMAWL